MAKPHKFTPSEIPARRANSPYADIISDFLAQGAESMQATIEGPNGERITMRCGGRDGGFLATSR